ncbi:TonB family protein [Rhizobium sp. Root482]|uniref:TonB family protein n=1 Tax=Rhizobium sp. Root482 TaxID=1736543 RepID=UPI0006F5BF98|nr:TonB family protein [Rhizobium sp. Root482]KQY15259.1 energy transducer TonB [Rhizobium sp. Root482]
MSNGLKWTAAIVLSLLAHAGAAKLLQPEPEPVLVAGGEAMEVAIIGNAFEDMIEAGKPDDPLDDQPEEIEPIAPEPIETAEAVPVSSQPLAPVPEEVIPAEADVIIPQEEIAPIAAEDPQFTATVATMAAATVIPQEKPEQPVETKALAPEPERKPEVKAKPDKEQPEKKTAKRKAGEEGKAQASRKKGNADGIETATAAGAAKGKKGTVSRQSGNAAVSNYPGKVRSKLQRAFRYPAKAKREKIRGVVQVSFALSSSGSVSSVSIAKSSGSAILDQAALEAVERAAPFPAIPQGAERKRWPFTIPLAFGR